MDIIPTMRHLRFLPLLAALILVSPLAGDAQAGMITFTGTTAGGPTFNRPLAGTPPTGLSGVGTAVRYNSQGFTVDAAGSYTFLSTATNPVNWDNYTFLYQTSFNPNSSLTNALIGNDDNPTIGLSGFTFSLAVNTTYFFVTTGFANTDFGAFSNTISGPGNIILTGASVPEPASVAMLGLGLTGVGAVARMRRKV